MSNPNSIKRKRQPKEYPRYPEATQRTLLRFIVSFAFDCNAMVQRTRQMLQADPDSSMIHSQVDYWLHALSAARDLAGRVASRQRHLIEMPEEAFEEVLEEWGLTCKATSGPERLSLSEPTSGKPKEVKRGGKSQGYLPVGNCGEQQPLLLTSYLPLQKKECD